MSDETLVKEKAEIKLPSAAELVEAGVHFGHKTSRWHPRMAAYIFTTKNNVHLFDVEKTIKKMEEAIVFMRGVLNRSGTILFVGTKPVAKAFIKETAQALAMSYDTERWLGGTLTNFKTITKRLQYYRELEEQQKTGGWDKYIKKERVQLQKKLTKLRGQLEGIKNLVKLPEALFLADAKIDLIAINEANRVGIPVVAICDSNVDPSKVDYPIQAKDDASPAIKTLPETVANNLKDIKPVVAAEKRVEKQNIKKEL